MEELKMRTYDNEFRIEAVKLAKEIGSTKASKELDVPIGTLDTWVRRSKEGLLKGVGASPKNALTLAEENKRLQQENRELKQTNEILRKATSFFAQSQKK
jgi:transposase